VARNSDDPEVTVSGGLWYHRGFGAAHPAASEQEFHNRLLQCLAELTGVSLP
jgi:hypothetical protein